jgi:hypothetical protein
MNYLRKELEKSIEITDEEWSFISSIFKLELVKKGERLYYTGDVFYDN